MIKKINYYLQFIFIKLVYLSLNLLPLKIASKTSGEIFKFIGNRLSINKIAYNNCKLVFPNFREFEIKNIIDNSWRNLGKNFFELSKLNKIINNKNLIKINGMENIQDFVDNKKQGIFFSIHQSNWEICVPILDKIGISIGAIYRHINNKYLDNLVYKYRYRSLTTKESFYTPKGIKSAKEIIENIKNKNSIFLLIDQKDSSGENVIFFKKNVKTQLGFLKIARKYNLPIIPLKNTRLKNGSFEIVFEKPFYNNNFNISDAELMKNIHKRIEKWIISNPSQWFWQHKRFN